MRLAVDDANKDAEALHRRHKAHHDALGVVVLAPPKALQAERSDLGLRQLVDGILHLLPSLLKLLIVKEL